MSRGLINEFSLQGAFESLIKRMACLPKVLEQFLSLSFSLIYTRTNTHISPKVIFPGSSFIEPCKKDCIFGFCLPGQIQNPQYLTENSLHSCHQVIVITEKATLLLTHFVHKGAPTGPGLTLGCPTWTEATRQNCLTQVVFFRGADVLKFTASHKLNTNFPPRWSKPLRFTKDTAQPQFFSEDLMAIHPSPALAPLLIFVSGNTFLSHRFGTL